MQWSDGCPPFCGGALREAVVQAVWRRQAPVPGRPGRWPWWIRRGRRFLALGQVGAGGGDGVLQRGAQRGGAGRLACRKIRVRRTDGRKLPGSSRSGITSPADREQPVRRTPRCRTRLRNGDRSATSGAPLVLALVGLGVGGARVRQETERERGRRPRARGLVMRREPRPLGGCASSREWEGYRSVAVQLDPFSG